MLDVISKKDSKKTSIVTTGKISYDVSGHLRNLPEGCKASEEKIATALEHGYKLLSRQTWVKPYKKGKIIA